MHVSASPHIFKHFFVSEGPYLDDNTPTKSTSDHHDESLLLNSDSLPIFLEEPQDSYVVKNRPATLKCRAAHALKLYFKCNGAKNVVNSKFAFVDPQTGVRMMEAEANVTRDMVEEFFANEKFKCECYAWSGRGSIRSQSATIDVACKWLGFEGGDWGMCWRWISPGVFLSGGCRKTRRGGYYLAMSMYARGTAN